MSRHVNMRREHVLRERAFREREQSFEATVYWYVFDPVLSAKDNVYDESGEKRFKKKAIVPVLWWFDEEGGDYLTPEGRRLQHQTTFAFTVGSLRNAGVALLPDDIVNDLLQWQGYYWEIVHIDFTSQSAIGDAAGLHPNVDSTVRVNAYRRFPVSDMPLDLFPVESSPTIPGALLYPGPNTFPGAP